MSRVLRVLIATDSFPPVCGGSGWSTWELARGLVARGHDARVLKISVDGSDGLTNETYGGLPVTVMHVRAPRTPFLRNIVKNERLWARIDRHLRTELRRSPVDVVHAQHVMTTVPAIRAGSATSVPVVATVRDYWPVCYWSDLIYDPTQPALCPGCSAAMMTTCVKPRAGRLAPMAWPLIPYMRANLSTKRHTLARASAIIAVSSAIARDLRSRAPETAATTIHTIPNPIDMTALDASAAVSTPQMAGPYVLYAGKLATNKGTQFLARALAGAGITWPLVVVGDGPERAAFESDARGHGLDVRMRGWRSRDEVWAWMRHATMLAFPSYGPESLSRVLIEAAALGAPIAAMNTGGTTDILTHGQTALVADDAAGLSRHLAVLAGDPALRARLGAAASADVHARFAAIGVVERVEQVYLAVAGRGAP